MQFYFAIVCFAVGAFAGLAAIFERKSVPRFLAFGMIAFLAIMFGVEMSANL